MARSPKGDDSSAGGKKRPAPKEGDPGYRTPTQLRNARKRRKLKNENSNSGRPSVKASESKDPSSKYLSSPQNAPVVQRAIRFFEDHPAKSSKTFDVTVGPTTGWRTVAKLAVRLSSGCLRIGLFSPGTHDLLEIPQCQAHHPRINSAVQILQKKCRQLDIPPYSETTGLGNLRHVLVNIERATGDQQITLVWKENDHENKDTPSLLRELCDALIQLSGNKHNSQLQLHSLWVHYNNNSKYDNNIVDRTGRWEQSFGPSSAVVEHLDIAPDHLTVPLEFPPQVFRQANIDAFSHIVVKIRSWIQERHNQLLPIRSCLELYGGVGTIGLHLVDLVSESFISSDENPFNKDCFKRALNQTQVKKPHKKCKNIRYESKSATDMVQDSRSEVKYVNLVVVDPPRKGLDSEVLRALSDDKQFPRLRSLVYVSCGFEAFCRDFDTLTRSGWKLDHAGGYLLFPGSDAIETLACFTRETII
jgi:23S rRNA (uracil1939-C5)-methyltransferase